ncbi:MAG: hypothetical protein CMD83_07210 [Gammaproteobacteria bacterium]|nr:hypothetical protein [Gammaproteobacteria bacterium]MBS03694.1 hypothetical protein [Gammaproteobacteria bacterium]|tara:strand:- start:1664 stop:2065 length:402 start_codon:yes stop_codon:yes gene_type:complete
MHKTGKIAAILLGVYVGIVALFESLLGYFQPANPTTLVITTRDDGGAHDRVLARLESDGNVYVAVNHWPRMWYYRALDNPGVAVTFEEQTTEYTAVPVTGAEHDRVDADNPLPLVFRILTGFPPRYFLRLDDA